MLKRTPIALFMVLGLAMAGMSLAAADPAPAASDATPHQIYEAAQSGHIAEAQQMIDQVLRDHPQNAKAHYVAAQLDARIGDLGAARQQLATAKQLDPTQSFTANRAELGTLERRLAGIGTVIPGTRPFAPAPRRSSVPWELIIVVGLGALILFSIFRSRAQRNYLQGAGPGLLPPGSPGLQSGYGYPPYPPAGGGSGLMGGLASGLAIGAGVAAGEELVRHVMDGNSAGDEPQNQDLGGADFGTQDGSSWGNDSGGGDAGGWGGDSGGGGDWS